MSLEIGNDPKDDGSKVPGFTYAWMIPYITRVARPLGYAIGVHGSMGRDLDLIAVPWVEDAASADELANRIAELTDGTVLENPNAPAKPHGRMVYTIVFIGAWHTIDLS